MAILLSAAPSLRGDIVWLGSQRELGAQYLRRQYDPVNEPHWRWETALQQSHHDGSLEPFDRHVQVNGPISSAAAQCTSAFDGWLFRSSSALSAAGAGYDEAVSSLYHADVAFLLVFPTEYHLTGTVREMARYGPNAGLPEVLASLALIGPSGPLVEFDPLEQWVYDFDRDTGLFAGARTDTMVEFDDCGILAPGQYALRIAMTGQSYYIGEADGGAWAWSDVTLELGPEHTPEPASLGLVVLGSLVLLARRRRVIMRPL